MLIDIEIFDADWLKLSEKWNVTETVALPPDEHITLISLHLKNIIPKKIEKYFFEKNKGVYMIL